MKNKRSVVYYVVETGLAACAIILVFMSISFSAAEIKNNKAIINSSFPDEQNVEFLNKAIELNKHNPAYYMNRGINNFRSNTDEITLDSLFSGYTISIPNSVLSDLEKSVSLSYGEPLPALNLAMAYSLNGCYDKAISVLKPLVKQKKCWPPVSIFYGLVLEFSHKREEAALLYIKAIIDSPIVLESVFFRDLELRDPELAIYVREQAEKRVSEAYYLTNNPMEGAVLGEIAFINGDIEKADSLLQSALSLLPSMDRSWLFLGRVYESKQKLDLAINCYEKASKLDEDDPLPKYFLNKIQGKTNNMAEQMKKLISVKQKIDFRKRYSSTISVLTLLDSFDYYCTYDYITTIKEYQKQINLVSLERIIKPINYDFDETFGELTAKIAECLIRTPCEIGLLDIYPEELRVYLNKTDKLQFVEECIAISLTLKQFDANNNGNADLEGFYEALCKKIQELRYRGGKIRDFSDRIYYMSEWLEQAETLGYLYEVTPKFGNIYTQSFSYFSDHIMFLTNIDNVSKDRERILSIEKALWEKNPYYIIALDRINQELYDFLNDGDIIGICSDRKGEDIADLGVICVNTDGRKKLLFASRLEKAVVEKDLLLYNFGTKGIRIWRLANESKFFSE